MKVLALDSGTAVRATPMPPRIGFGPEEEKDFMECIAHYRNLDSDPPSIGLWNKLFSEVFAEYQGGGFYLPVISGTGAIYVSLASLGLPKGLTVLTSPVTCSGVLSSIQALGFVPKVVDSSPSSFNVGVEQVKARISKDVRCLLVTHAVGEPVDVPAIREAINDDSILILEDCSQATGASICGEKVGTWGEKSQRSQRCIERILLLVQAVDLSLQKISKVIARHLVTRTVANPFGDSI